MNIALRKALADAGIQAVPQVVCAESTEEEEKRNRKIRAKAERLNRRTEKILERSRKIPVRLSNRPPTNAEFRRETRAKIRNLKSKIRIAEREVRELEQALQKELSKKPKRRIGNSRRT